MYILMLQLSLNGRTSLSNIFCSEREFLHTFKNNNFELNTVKVE